ncbi:MAG: penicillin-binding transpeptidase domain-containing protein [Bryobacteraceae bacterium]
MRKRSKVTFRALYGTTSWLFVLSFLCFNGPGKAESSAAPATKQKKRTRRVAPATNGTAAATRTSVAKTALVRTSGKGTTRSATGRTRRRRLPVSPWTEPTYADSTVGDSVEGEDLEVRRAAVEALGPYNGTVVVTDTQTGRILTIVNQKLGLKGAYQPCSTVKVVVSLASLTEGLVDSRLPVHLTRRYAMNMTEALARSNNLYFAKLGQQLGFERVSKYARLYGLGEKAGLDIPGEEPGFLTEEPPPTGVGMMTSFGDGIRVTPLELSSIVTSIANGGTMYYLQYPRSDEDVKKFVPRIKRTLEIGQYVPQLKAGMLGAVEYGTARRAIFDPNEPVLGKTGTCTDTAQPGVHLGWFGSFNEVGRNKLAVVVLLTGGRGISGPIASGVAGNVYRNLAAQHYFEPEQPGASTALISLQSQQTNPQ